MVVGSPFRRVFSPRSLAVVTIVALAVVGGSASADEPTPLEVFRRYYGDRDASVRRKAVLALKPVTGPEVADALLDALDDDDARVRRAAREQLFRHERGEGEIDRLVRALSRERDADVAEDIVCALGAAGVSAAPALLDALESSVAPVRARAARELGGLDGLDDAASLASLAALHESLADREDHVRAEAVAAIGSLAGAESVGAAAAVLRGDRGAVARVAAAAILEAHPDDVGLEHLRVVVRDRSWVVRVACARALGRQITSVGAARQAADALVHALESERRVRVSEEIATALFRLTGIDFGPAPERWRAWFDEVGATFRPPERAPRRAVVVPGGTRAGLLDLPTSSDHVTFVLDGSHSMSDPVRFGSETTKQTQLNQAFERALARLPEGSWANVIPFGSEPKPYKPALFRATPQARRAAVRFLEKRAPDGRTNIFDSLVVAFADPDVDTVVLVTDGAPSEGARTTRTGILEGIEELNRFRLVRIHTVEIGAGSTGARWRGFLEQIAESTGGHYLAR